MSSLSLDAGGPLFESRPPQAPPYGPGAVGVVQQGGVNTIKCKNTTIWRYNFSNTNI